MSNSTFRTISASQIDGISATRNYIGNGAATDNTAGWATYADAAGSSPVDGTGGSPSVTWTRSTSSPLSLDASFIFNKDAANRQGQGASFDFTIQSCDQAKVLQISFDYAVASGTFAAGSSSSDSDITVWIYDVTNAQVIQPATFRLFASTSLSSQFVSSFQTNSNSTSYRLILHCSTTSASAYTLKIDNVVVAPTVTPPVFGAIPVTTQRFTSGSGTYTTPPNVKYIKVKMVGGGGGGGRGINSSSTGGGGGAGGYYEFLINNPSATYSYSVGSGGSGATSSGGVGTTGGNTSFGANTANGGTGGGDGDSGTGGTVSGSLGTTIVASTGGGGGGGGNWNTAGYPGGIGGSSPFGGAGRSRNGTSLAGGSAAANTGSGGAGGASGSTSGNGGDGAAGVIIVEEYYQTAGADDGRIVAMEIRGQFAGMDSSTNAKFTSVSRYIDTHGAFNNTTGIYTIPVTGWYNIVLNFDTGTGSNVYRTFVYKNGSQDTFLGYGASGGVGLSGTIYVVAGDQISIRSASSMASYIASCGMSISKVSPPSNVGATETVAFGVNTSTSTASTSAPFIHSVKEFDTHNSYSTSTGKFTAPVSGIYQFNATAYSTTAAEPVFYKNGVSAYGGTEFNNGTIGVCVMLTRMNAGDTMEVRCSVSATASGGSKNNTFSGFKVGN